MHESEKWKWSRSVLSDSSRPHGLQPTRLLHPWDFPGRSTGVGCHCLLQDSLVSKHNNKLICDMNGISMSAKSFQLCLTLCYLMNCNLTGSSVHGIFQARILEQAAMPFSRGSSWPRDGTHVSYVSYIEGRFFIHWATWEPWMEYRRWLTVNDNFSFW